MYKTVEQAAERWGFPTGGSAYSAQKERYQVLPAKDAVG